MARDAVLIAYVALACFVWGTSYVQGFQEYHYWRDLADVLSRDEFAAIRAPHYWKIFALAVFPGVAALALNFVLLAWRPRETPFGLVVANAVLGLAVAVATFAVLVPIQDVIDAGAYTRATFDALIFWDVWLRKLPGTVNVLLAIAMLALTLHRRGREPAA